MERTNTRKRGMMKDERGAAMVMVLLLSLLMLVASAGLLLEVSMNTANVTDATAEQQAYNAAESGIQSAINVLRGNVVPSPLLDSSQPATHPNNMINFRRAVNPGSSNLPTDTATSARLSRWINYNFSPTGSSIGDRVTLGDVTYNPQTGNAFDVSLTDPDNTGTSLTYYVTGAIEGGSTLREWGGSGNSVRISYQGVSSTTLNVSTGLVNTTMGRWVINVNGAGATITERARFSITVNMTAPYTATKVIRGWIEPGTITPTSVGTVRIFYDSEAFILMGSAITLTGGTAINNMTVDPPRVGYEVTPNAQNVNSGVSPIAATMTAAEPIRVVVRSVGYGPRGSRKMLEAVVQKNFFNGMPAPATLTLVGSNSGFEFDPGSSNVTSYSGDDVITNVLIPPIGTTNSTNLTLVQDSVDGRPPHPFNGTIIGTPSNISAEIPAWLQTAANLDTTIQSLRNVAMSSGRYYADGVTPPNFGDNANARGITFADGDVSFTGPGGGILVCTGKLTLNGNFNFNGLIIVTGEGGVDRQGAGEGIIQGNIVIAPYRPDDLAAGFLGPKYNLSGGGASNIVYNSSSITNGLIAISNFVLGVAEK